MRNGKSLRLGRAEAPAGPTGISCLWRRLDAVGHDACRYTEDDIGWLIEGCAVFTEDGQVATLSYRVRCDAAWNSRSASIDGWLGDEVVAIEIVHSSGNRWNVNGRDMPLLAGLVDIDLGFTPATNANAVRRLNLAVGEQGETIAAWLDTADWQVKPLRQTYARIDETRYDYAAPAQDFRARLTTDDFGAIVEYPGLWHRE